jgi:hypothetical protein
MLMVQISAADDAASAIPLPPGSLLSAAAQSAPEAPRWNPQPAPAQSTPAITSAQVAAPATNSSIPATVNNIAPAAINNPAPPAIYNSAPAAPDEANAANPLPRPLVSIMKRRPQPATSPATPTIAAPPPLAGSTATAVVPPSSTIPSATTAPPATLTAQQTAGALPINAVPPPPSETAASTIPSSAVPSGVVPAHYDQLDAGPANGVPAQNFNVQNFNVPNTNVPDANVPSANVPSVAAWNEATSNGKSAAPSNNSAVPSAMAPAANGMSEISSSATQPLQPAAAPPQLVPPPDKSVRISSPHDDSFVTPAETQSTDPTIDPGQQAAARAAADLLATSISPATGATDGLSLTQFLARCPESDRASAVQAYWRWCTSLSASNWAQDEQKRLEQIAPGPGAAEVAMLSTARAAAAARITEAEIEATSASDALIRVAASLQDAGTSRPTDSPLVAPYRTYYSQIFTNRPSGRALEIDHILPIRLKAIDDRAAAVQSAASAVHDAEQAHAKKQIDLPTVLACHDELHNERRQFLSALLQYNVDVAEYAALAAPTGTPPEKFVAMLIRPKSAERLSAVPERSTFNDGAGTPPPKFAPSGRPSAELTRPSLNSVRTPKSGVQSHPAASDGWVPSTLRPLEPEPLQADQQSSPAESTGRATTASPLGPQADPFAPSVGDRYGNRYNTDGR